MFVVGRYNVAIPDKLKGFGRVASIVEDELFAVPVALVPGLVAISDLRSNAMASEKRRTDFA